MAGGPVLALCASRCSGPWPFSVALRHGDQLVVDAPVPGSRADLPAHAVALCRAAGIAPQSLAEVRIDLGPGSYVGLRVAVTLARFLHREAGVRLLAATSLELMACASATRHALDGSTVHVLLDARRGRWHAQSLHVGTDHIEPRSQPHALPPPRHLHPWPRARWSSRTWHCTGNCSRQRANGTCACSPPNRSMQPRCSTAGCASGSTRQRTSSRCT